MRARLANRAWALAARPAARAFEAALADPRAAQERVLAEVLRVTRETAYGRSVGLGRVRDLAGFQDRVPAATWDDLAPFVDRIAAGESRVLTTDPVRMLEPTGGSSGGTKRIPYTATLQRQVRRAVGAWIADLFAHCPAAATGPAYWSVSPAIAQGRTEGGIPVGFEDDGAYLSPLHRTLARATLAAPGALRHVSDVGAFRYATLRHLLARPDLALVSVWNPTFLTLLLRPLRTWASRLADDLEHGTLSADVPEAVAHGLRPQPRRAARLRDLAATADDPALYRALWPRLALVSAWADGHAETPAGDLRKLLPHSAFQPKGLIATEGIVTIPRWGHDGAAPALTSHVIEFEPEGGGRPVFADAVEPGGRYEVLLTTGGGLVRYRLGDVVEAVGRIQNTPLVRFVERAGPTSDRVGEKLHAGHVARAIRATGLGGFAMLAPDGDADPVRYVLFSDADVPDARLLEAADALDRALCDNVHYGHARRLGQLGPVAAFRVRGDAEAATLAGCAALGQRLGDVKPAALHRDGGWARRFEGAFVGMRDS